MVLIVDDDSSICLSIRLALDKAGIAGSTVSNEEDALVAVRDESVSLVLLDMNLTLTTTGQQGLNMLRKIRILRPDIPVILITAWGTIPLAVKAMSLGAYDFLTKPWRNEDLVAKVRQALDAAIACRRQSDRVDTLDDIERRAIIEAIHRCDGNIAEAARQLGITRQALYRRIEKFGI